MILCRLREADEKYENRESRPEDLVTIKQLQEAIQQRERALKTIMVRPGLWARDQANIFPAFKNPDMSEPFTVPNVQF